MDFYLMLDKVVRSIKFVKERTMCHIFADTIYLVLAHLTFACADLYSLVSSDSAFFLAFLENMILCLPVPSTSIILDLPADFQKLFDACSSDHSTSDFEKVVLKLKYIFASNLSVASPHDRNREGTSNTNSEFVFVSMFIN